MRIKIYLRETSNFGKLIRLIEKSSGNVLLRLADSSLKNLKNNKTAEILLKQETDNCHGVEIYVLDAGDCPAFISFMMGGCV